MHNCHLGWALGLSMIGFISGCGQASATNNEGLVKATSALQVQVSQPFDVQAYPTDFDLTSPDRAKLACGTSHCLMIYNLTLPDDINRVFATRFDANGTRLDEPSLQISKNEYILRVGARGDEFLVVTSQHNQFSTSTVGTVHYYRVRGSDGAVLEDVTSRMPKGIPYKIASTGSTWMIVYPGVSYYASLSLYDASLQPIGTPVPFQALTYSLEVVPGPDQYFVVGSGLYQRIDESTGAPIESAPVKYTQYLSPSGERAAYLNGFYEIVCGNGIRLYGWRVNAATGALLDPDDTFNGKTGAKVLRDVSATVSNVPQGIEVDAFDNNIIVSFFSSYWEVDAMRVDITTGLPVSNTVDSFGSVPGSITTGGTFQFNVLGQSAFLMDNDQYIKVGTTEASPLIANFPGAWQTAAVPAYLRQQPQVASNGSNYLVAFTVGSTTPHVYATRIDANTGAYLDSPPILMGAGYHPAVVSTSSGYLISWINPGASGGTYAYLSQFPPEPQSTGQAYISSSNIAVTPRFAFNGDYLFGTWGNFAARMTATGGIVPPDGLAAGASRDYSLGFWYTDAVNDPGAVVVGDTTPTSAYRTFLVVGNSGTSTSPSVSAIRIRSATGAMQATTLVAAAHLHPYAATDGTNFLVVSNANGTQNWDGVFVDAISGLPVGTPVRMASLTSSQSVAGLFFDGTNYNLLISDVYVDLTVDALYLRRFDTSLNRLAEDGTGVGTLLSGSYPFRWYAGAATLANGRSMAVFDAIDPARAGTAIKGVFIATDGSTPTLGTGGAGGNTSAGGGSALSTGGSGGVAQSTASGGSAGTSSVGGLGGAGGSTSSSAGSGGTTAAASATGAAGTSASALGGAGGGTSSPAGSGGTGASANTASGTSASALGGAGGGTSSSPAGTGGMTAASSATEAGGTSVSSSNSSVGGSSGVTNGGSSTVSGGQSSVTAGGTTSSTLAATTQTAGAGTNATSTNSTLGGAGTSNTGEASSNSPNSNSGCGCRLEPARSPAMQFAWLLGLALALVRGRRGWRERQ